MIAYFANTFAKWWSHESSAIIASSDAGTAENAETHKRITIAGTSVDEIPDHQTGHAITARTKRKATVIAVAERRVYISRLCMVGDGGFTLPGVNFDSALPPNKK